MTYSLRRGSSRTLFWKILTWTEREPAGRPLVGPTRYPAQPVVDRIPQRKQKLTQRRKAAKTQGRSEHRLLNIEHPTSNVERPSFRGTGRGTLRNTCMNAIEKVLNRRAQRATSPGASPLAGRELSCSSSSVVLDSRPSIPRTALRIPGILRRSAFDVECSMFDGVSIGQLGISRLRVSMRWRASSA